VHFREKNPGSLHLGSWARDISGHFGTGFQKKKEIPDDPARNHLFDRGFLSPRRGV
jgi:hypothetical protein